MKKNRWFVLFMILAAYVAVTGLTIGCPIRYVTGIPCPGCGMTRAFLSLLSGHVREAFFYHPLFFAVPVLFYGIIRYDKKADKASMIILGTTAALFFAVWILRLTTGDQVMRQGTEGGLFQYIRQLCAF